MKTTARKNIGATHRAFNLTLVDLIYAMASRQFSRIKQKYEQVEIQGEESATR